MDGVNVAGLRSSLSELLSLPDVSDATVRTHDASGWSSTATLTAEL